MSIGRDTRLDESQPSTPTPLDLPALPPSPVDTTSEEIEPSMCFIDLNASYLQGASLETLSQAPVAIISPTRPVSNKFITDYALTNKMPKETFHQIYHAMKKSEYEDVLYYYKFNPLPNQLPMEQEASISELEAIAAAYYKLLAPEITPDTHAVLNEQNEYVGVISKQNPHFKPIGQDTLKESDLETSTISSKNLYAEMDSIEEDIIQLENAIAQVARIRKKIADNETSLRETHKHLQTTGSATNPVDMEKLKKTIIDLGERRTRADLDEWKYTAELGAIFQDLQKKYGINKDEFDRFRMIKGLAIALSASYIHMEDDLHIGNISKYGERIDFDMSLWPILFDFKNSSVVDVTFRRPSKDAWDVHSDDIQHFPNLTHAKPYFWPTKTTISQVPRELLKTFVSISTNNYSAQMNATYSKLENHPVFKHYKFFTFFKFILIDPVIFRKIALLHMQEACTFKSRPVIDLLEQTMQKRTKDITKSLLSLSDFMKFITKDGDICYKQIVGHFIKKNNQHSMAIANIENTIHNLRSESQKLSEINEHLATQLTALEKLMHNIYQPARTSAAGSPPTPSKFLEDDKLNQFKQKLDEQKLRADEYEKNEVMLRSIAKDCNQKEAECAAHLSQIMDISWIEKKYEDIIKSVIAKKSQLADYQSTLANFPQSLMTSMKGLLTFSMLQQSSTSAKPANSMSLIDYKRIKDKVIAEMELYKNPGLMAFMGKYRTHTALASTLVKFANENQPTSDNPHSHIKAIRALKEQLELHKTALEKTNSVAGMHTTLVKLLSDMDWDVLNPIMDMNNSLSI